MTAPTLYPDLIQGSDEWLEARRGIVTASVVGKLVTPTLKVADNDTSRALTRLLVAERITGFIVPTYQTDAMMRGTMDEPLARNLYREHHRGVREFGFITRDLGNGAILGYSPDGLVGGDGLIEVKSREPHLHLAVILGADIPHAHMAQMQAGMLASGREWTDYLSYCGGMPMHVRRVERDAAWADAITRAVVNFERIAVAMTASYERAVEGLPATERIDYFQEAVI